jgi:cyclase
VKLVTANVYAEDRFSVPPYDRGCNPGLVVTTGGLVMVDTPMWPTDAVRWRNEIAGLGQVIYIVNTHHHPDHIAGNYFFPGCVVAHELVKPLFRQPVASQVVSKPALAGIQYPILPEDSIRLEIKYADPEGYPLMKDYFLREPTLTFSQQLNLYLGGHTFELLHLPGHTAGHIGVFVPEEKVFFAGDNFNNQFQPLLSNCLPLEWIDSLKRIESLDIDYVVPGHGAVCGRREIREFRQFIETCVSLIRGALRRGMSREEAAAEISFEGLYPAVHPGAEQQRYNVLWLYDVLAKKT